MATANRVMVIGNLTKEPQIRSTASGLSVASFSLAIEDTYANAKNEAVKRTNYPPCKAWGKQVEKLAGLQKGDCVGVIGKIVTGSYEDKNGVKHYTTDVVADKLMVFAIPRVAEQEAPQSLRNEMPLFGDEEVEIPF